MSEVKGLQSVPGENPLYDKWVENLKNLEAGDTKFEVKPEDESTLKNVLFWMNDTDKAKEKLTSEQFTEIKSYVTSVADDPNRKSALKSLVEKEQFKESDAGLHKSLGLLADYVEGNLTFPDSLQVAEAVPTVPVSTIPLDQDPEGTTPPPLVEQPQAGAKPPETAKPVDTTSAAPDKPTVEAPTDEPGSTPPEGSKTGAPPTEGEANLESFVKKTAAQMEGGGKGMWESLKSAIKALGALMASIGSITGTLKDALTSMGNKKPESVGTKVAESTTIDVDLNRVTTEDQFTGPNPSVAYVKKCLQLESKTEITDTESLLKYLKGRTESYEYIPDEQKTELSKLEKDDIVFFSKEGEKSVAGSTAIVSRVVEGEPKKIFIRHVKPELTSSYSESELSAYMKTNPRYMGYLRKKVAAADAPAPTSDEGTPVTPDPVTPPASPDTKPVTPDQSKQPEPKTKP